MQDNQGKGKKVGKKILLILAIIVATLLALYALIFSYTNRILALFIVALGVLTVAVGYLFVKKYIKIYNNYKTKTLNATNNAQKKWYKNTTIVRFVILSLVAVGALLVFSGIIVEYRTKDTTALGINLVLGGFVLSLLSAVFSVLILVAGREEPDFTDQEDETQKESSYLCDSSNLYYQKTQQDNSPLTDSEKAKVRKEKLKAWLSTLIIVVGYVVFIVLALIFEKKENLKALHELFICFSVYILLVWVYTLTITILDYCKKCKQDTNYRKSKANIAKFVLEIISIVIWLVALVLIILTPFVEELWGVDYLLFKLYVFFPLSVVTVIIQAVINLLKNDGDNDDFFDNEDNKSYEKQNCKDINQTPNSHNNQE